MNLPLFYDAQARAGETLLLDPAEATHITKALRLRSGNTIAITDGQGHLFQAELEVVKHQVNARVVSVLGVTDHPVNVELAIAPTKNNDRLEWFVEKAVELGIGRITLVLCDHSERPRVSLDRLQRVAVAALKQSGRTYLPVISELVALESWLKSCSAQQRGLAHCMEDSRKMLLRDFITRESSVAIAIGPEGDFSPREVASAKAAGFQSVSLGNARLRTETAALAAVHTFNLLNQ